jgi:glutathione S-transferase
MPNLCLYELENALSESTSPFVWRVKFALQFKRLHYERKAVSFFDIPRIGPGSIKTVPAIEHHGRYLTESWAIVEWLDATFANRPLFRSPAELSMVRFFDKWFGANVLRPMFRSCVIDIFNRVKPEEQAYFRASREELIGQSLEAVAAEADSYIARMREALLPMRLALRQLPYLGGEEPNYADHIAWSAFVGFAPILSKPLLEEGDSLRAWLERGVEQARQAGGHSRPA